MPFCARQFLFIRPSTAADCRSVDRIWTLAASNATAKGFSLFSILVKGKPKVLHRNVISSLGCLKHGAVASRTSLRASCELLSHVDHYAELVTQRATEMTAKTGTDPGGLLATMVRDELYQTLGHIEETAQTLLHLAAVEACAPGKYVSLMHIYALATVVGVNIRSVYPNRQPRSRPFFNTVVLPRN